MKAAVRVLKNARPVAALPIDARGIGLPAPSEAVEQSLYEIRVAIHPRAVHGWFAAWRWALVWATQIVFYGTAWLEWNGRQAVLFDLVQRKFHIFGLVLWPQDFIYLTALLVISALSLFLFTAVAGRLWCGYACPQTVYTEIFMWVEKAIEGDRNRRIKLDQSPLTLRKAGLKAAKHAAWGVIALWTGFTFVGYFTPIRELAAEVATFSLGPWEAFWTFFYAFATYGNAGWMREQVCKHMCPYARFQSAMFDRDTLVIAYDAERGEQRGSRAKSADPKTLGLGACVDCGICVQVCPTGIDIRNGLQYECIGCAACVDGCDQVMEKVGYPKGLIRYSTSRAVEQRMTRREMFARAFRPRILVYSAILWIIISAASASLWMRLPLKVDVIRDRAAISREIPGGLVENVYRLQVMNTAEQDRRFLVRVEGVASATLAGETTIEMAGASTRMATVKVRAKAGDLPAGTHKVRFVVEAEDDAHVVVSEKSVFIVR